MTVAELIEELKKYPADNEVTYLDPEWGGTSVHIVKPDGPTKVLLW